MFWVRHIAFIVLLLAFGNAVSLSLRRGDPTLSLENPERCNEKDSNLKVTLNYGDDPAAAINYLIYHSNGTAIYRVAEWLDPANKDKFHQKKYDLDSSVCHTLFVNKLGRWDSDLQTYFDYYSIRVDFDGKVIMEGKTDELQFIKVGNCPSHTCAHGEAMLHIQMNGRVDDYPDSTTFDYAIYDSSGAVVEKQKDGYRANIEELNYFERFVCLNSFECHTVWIDKNAWYQVDFEETILEKGYSGDHTSVLKAGQGNCPVCDSKTFLLNASSNNQRANDIMSMIATISSMEILLATDSPQHQAACWIIHHDPYQVSAADKSLLQRYILALLFFSTSGWDWSTKDSFLSPVTECHWNNYRWGANGTEWDYILYGVKCNENGNVVQINLSKSN